MDELSLLAELREEKEKAHLELKHFDELIARSALGRKREAAQVRYNDLREQEQAEDTRIREHTLEMYRITGDKPSHPALKIKMYTVLVYDPEMAFNYAREHLTRALRLDKRTFEKVAKVLDLDFVEQYKEPRVTIARDLSESLPSSTKEESIDESNHAEGPES